MFNFGINNGWGGWGVAGDTVGIRNGGKLDSSERVQDVIDWLGKKPENKGKKIVPINWIELPGEPDNEK